MLQHHYPVFKIFRGKRVHFGLTGSVAAYKILELLRLLKKSHIDAGATLTNSAASFVTPLSLQALGADPVYSGSEYDQADIFSHLSPGRTAHSFFVAPATANIISKAACGLGDDLLSTQLLAWKGAAYFCPAMNPAMWDNSAVVHNIDVLIKRGHTIIMPHEGSVACGQTGTGRLAPVAELYYHVLRSLGANDLEGQKVLITAGPTHEYYDLVRFLSNPSSGKMGLAIALACWIRGAQVYFVHGPMAPVSGLPGFEPIAVTTAMGMFDACSSLWHKCDKGIFSAAVSDFAPVPCPDAKFKKQGIKSVCWEMNSNPDILAEMSSRKTSHQTIAGFAAEADHLEENAHLKLRNKQLDIIVANHVQPLQTPFGSNDNKVFVMDKHGRRETWPKLSKAEVAWRLIDWFSLI